MLSPKELKIVLNTLSQRRAWLKKSVEGSDVAPEAKEESIDALKLLDSSIKKLSSLTNKVTSTPVSSSPPPNKNKNAARSPVSFSDARILVAEDNEDSAVLLIDLLADMGIRSIDHAKDGIEAFDKIKRAEEPYHIILCDWDMPELSGLDVHNKAKASNTLRGAHFIMVTAMTEAPKIKQAAMQGIKDYIAKPIDIDKLEEKIKKSLSNSRTP